jgi:2-keto-4-pentenoate hydratase/2-oxohepta-3-ene-1,7-dioic acid hydratase in catechol pathway
MKLLNFYNEAGRALGILEGDHVFNLTAAADGAKDFLSVTTWVRGGDKVLEQTRDLLDKMLGTPESGVPLSAVRHAPMVDRDCQLFCVGLNYADHAAENNLPPPTTPIFFTKLASVAIPHLAAIPLPAGSHQVDYEAEMAIMLGSRADRVTVAEAARCIAGYTIMNDVSARDLQRNDKQWFRGKNCNGFGPMGPWLVTTDEILYPHNMDITLRLNGQVRQHSNTRNLIFTPEALVSILSQTLVLEPGDTISTGTPAGVGFHLDPQMFLQPGDQVEIELQGVGVLRNGVVNRTVDGR